MSIETSAPPGSIVSPTLKAAYIDWPAIIGGILFASAISVVLLAFGSGIGLSFTDVTASKNSVIWVSVAAAIWFLWVEVSSFMAGAYLTGRLRRSVTPLTLHETEVRDGSHGLLMWAGCVLVGTALAFSGASSAVTSLGNIVKTATQSAATAGGGAAPQAMQYYSDTLLRPTAQAAASPRPDRAAVGNEVGMILARSAISAPNDEDRAYLAQVVTTQTGVSDADAKTRVDGIYTALTQAKADAAQAAEAARRAGIIGAFLLAASLLVSGAAAAWATIAGAKHKDEVAVYGGFFKRM